MRQLQEPLWGILFPAPSGAGGSMLGLQQDAGADNCEGTDK